MSAFEKDSKCDGHESSDFPEMPEHLGDSNILQSRKTYGRSFSVCSENSASFPAVVEELCAENNLESAASIPSGSYSKNYYQKDVDSEFCLFSDADNYVSGSAEPPNHGISFIHKTVRSDSNYQRTRKNLKDYLNKEQKNSEEKFEVNKLPQKSSETMQVAKQVGPLFGRALSFNHSLINQSTFSLVDLAKKFSVGNNRACAKNNPSSKKIKKECELAPLKKKSVTNSAALSKINSLNKKTLNSTVSDRKSSKNVILKSDVINDVNLVVKKSDTKIPSKSMWKRNIKVESIGKIGCVRNADTPWKGCAKTASKTVQRENIRRSIKVLTKYLSKKKFVKNNIKDKVKSSLTRKTSNLLTNAPRKNGAKIPSNAVHRKSIKRSIKLLTKYVYKNKFVKSNVKDKVKSSITPTISNLHLVRNGTAGKIQSDHNEKQTEKPPAVHSNEKAIQNHFLNVPVTFAPISQETIPFCIRSSNTFVADDHSIQNNSQAVSYGNFEDLAIPGPSTLSNNHSSMNATTFLENPVYQEQEMRTGSFMSFADDHSIQNDSQAVSHGNFEDLAIPGPYTLSNNHSNMSATFFLENPAYQEQEMRTGSFMSLGISFEQSANDYFQSTENTCILRKCEMADNIFSSHPSLCNITVSQFCNFPQVTAVFCDYLDDCIGIPPDCHDDNEGYDFPENLDTENLLSVVKDFVHSIIFYIIPKDGPKPTHVSYLQIISAAMHKMSFREKAIVMRVFGKKSSLDNPFEKLKFKLDDMLSKLDFVALLVIFHEYRSRKLTSNV